MYRRLAAGPEYVPGGHERQKLDLYLPEKASGLPPVIVRVHGGGWQEDNKDWRRAVPLLEGADRLLHRRFQEVSLRGREGVLPCTH